MGKDPLLETYRGIGTRKRRRTECPGVLNGHKLHPILTYSFQQGASLEEDAATILPCLVEKLSTQTGIPMMPKDCGRGCVWTPGMISWMLALCYTPAAWPFEPPFWQGPLSIHIDVVMLLTVTTAKRETAHLRNMSLTICSMQRNKESITVLLGRV